jgi:hypothetical protein
MTDREWHEAQLKMQQDAENVQAINQRSAGLQQLLMGVGVYQLKLAPYYSLQNTFASLNVGEPDTERESREATEQNMRSFSVVREFMERVLPLEICRTRYPEAYSK